jgi:hypothetical protein
MIFKLRDLCVFVLITFGLYHFCHKCLKSKTQIVRHDEASLNYIIKLLAIKVNSYQVLSENTDQLGWYRKSGLFRSEIRFNFFGGPMLQRLRNGRFSYVYDNNMFSTAWIVTALLEANLYGKGAPQFDSDRLALALDSINTFNDKNRPSFNESLIKTFWSQLFNETVNTWQQQPTNLRGIAIRFYQRVNELEKLFEFLNLNETIFVFEMIKKLIDMCLQVLQIPPDFDDSFVNLGLGSVLSQRKQAYPEQFRKWLASNSALADFVNLTNKYTYKPFDSDLNKNLVDPRTYFYSRSFVEKAAKKNQALSLFTTWVQNIDEQRELQQKGVSMPFNLNNVDVTVLANSIYGITAAALLNVNNFSSLFMDSKELVNTYLNSTKFVASMIRTNFSSRPDLATMYYPSNLYF